MTSPPRRLLTLVLSALLVACGQSRSAPPLPARTIAHGPFEIVAGVRRVSTGTFPNQGGNPFATSEVHEFQLRHGGQVLRTPGGSDRFWRVLRLDGAPRPALLLVTSGFVLVTAEPDGRVAWRPLRAESSSLAESQWLDSLSGQPGPSESYGIEAVADLDTGTRLAGGRWLRLGSRVVIDVATLTVHEVEPWVPIVPGVPITSLSRDGDEVRAFSPRRSAYVLAASGYDYARNGAPAHGLLVVDIGRGNAEELRLERRSFRFADARDIDAAWIDHHFEWQVDAGGRETLKARAGARPWAWRSRVVERGSDRVEIEIPRVDAALLGPLRRLLAAEPGAQIVREEANGFDLRIGDCPLQMRAFGAGGSADDRRIGLWPSSDVSSAVCAATVRRLAERIDAELASGRHEAIILLD